MPRLFQRPANGFGVLHHVGELGHGFHRLHDVVFLIAHGPQRRSGKLQGIAGSGIIAHLAGYYKHGNGIQPAANHAGDGVGAARAGGDTHRSNLVFQPGIGFRRNGASLLVVVVGYLQPFVMTQRVVEVHGAAANNGKHIRNAFADQKVSHIIRKPNFHCNPPL